MELDLRWKRVGRNGDENSAGKREKMGKARTSAEPVRLSATCRICMSLLQYPEQEKERDRRIGKGQESG